MKQQLFFASCLFGLLTFMLVACDKDKTTESPADQADTVWQQQPFDTLAAQEGRVWRSERHWTGEGKCYGYSVTITHLDDSCFRSDVFLTEGNFYIRFFTDGTIYRYRLTQTTGGDTLLLAKVLDSEEEFDATMDDAFVFRHISDSLVKLRCLLDLNDEGIDQFDFKRIQI